MLAHLLLGAAQIMGLLMIPFGAPGVWVQIAALTGYAWWSGFDVIGEIPLLILACVALGAELTAATVDRTSAGDRRTRRRAGFAGLAGGGAGAAIGVPLPLLGSMFGAVIGAFAGSLAGVVVARPDRTRVSAFGGLLVATTMKTAAGLSVAAYAMLTLFR